MRQDFPDCACQNVCMFPRMCLRRAKQKMEIWKIRQRWLPWPRWVVGK